MRYRFGTVELDAASYTLRRDGREVAVQPRVFDVLRYLVEHRDQVLSREALLEALWPGEHVTKSVVAWSVSHARNALGESRGQDGSIETVPRRGYRFRGTVEVIAPPQLNGPRAQPAQPPAVARSSARPFVGRGEVMRRLEALMRDAQGGNGRLCLLHGEAGIGKTRCSEELSHAAARSGIHAFAGRAVEGAGSPVFWPWIQIVRDVLRVHPELREGNQSVLSRLTAPDDESADNDVRRTSADRFWLLDDVTRLLLQSTRDAPAVVLLDDLQWADAGTLDLLSFMTADLSAAHILVVATARMGTAPDCDARLARLAHKAERIELKRLSPDDINDYITELTSLPHVPASVARAVHRATAGNPLFVQETVRTLLAEHGKDAMTALTESDIQPRNVLQARLALLAPEARSLLTHASILGEEFDVSLLQALSGLQLDALLDLLERAQQLALIVPLTPQRYRFSHGLIRDVLYEESNAAARVALHRRAAELLAAQRVAEPHSSEIAHHYYRSLPAGGYDRVTAAARRAATAAEAVYAFEDAARFYSWALEAQACDETVAARERAELLMAAGSAQRLAGRDGEARQTLARMFALAREHRFADLLVRGARTLRPTSAMSSLPDPLVRDALENALKNTPEPADEPNIRAIAQLSCVPPYATDMARSKEMSARALALARKARSQSLLFDVLRSRFYSLSGPDDIDAVLAETAEVVAIEGDHPTPASLEAYTTRAGALIYRGEIAAADRAFEAVRRIASDLGLREVVWYSLRQAAQRRFLDGHFESAEAACSELRSRGEQMGLSYSPWLTQVLRHSIEVERGHRETLATSYDFSLLTQSGPDVHLNVKVHMTRAAAELGRTQLARLGLDALAAMGFETIPKDIAYLRNLANIAQAVVALADQPRAEELYSLLAPYPHHNTPDQTLLYDGSVSRYLALLAECLGWNDRAERHFEDALVQNQRIGQRAMVARTSYEYARWLAKRRSTSARARALELSRSAASLSETLGMTWLAERSQRAPSR